MATPVNAGAWVIYKIDPQLPDTQSIPAGSRILVSWLNQSTGPLITLASALDKIRGDGAGMVGVDSYEIFEQGSSVDLYSDPVSRSWFIVSGGLGGTSGPPLSVADPTFPSMAPATPITPFYVVASGGVPPYTHSDPPPIGALPAGVTIDSGTGLVSGPPSGAGSGSVVFRVTDDVGTIVDTSSIPWAVEGIGEG